MNKVQFEVIPNEDWETEEVDELGAVLLEGKVVKVTSGSVRRYYGLANRNGFKLRTKKRGDFTMVKFEKRDESGS